MRYAANTGRGLCSLLRCVCLPPSLPPSLLHLSIGLVRQEAEVIEITWLRLKIVVFQKASFGVSRLLTGSEEAFVTPLIGWDSKLASGQTVWVTCNIQRADFKSTSRLFPVFRVWKGEIEVCIHMYKVLYIHNVRSKRGDSDSDTCWR